MEETKETFFEDTEATEAVEEAPAETQTDLEEVEVAETPQKAPETVKVTKGKRDSTPAEVAPETPQEAPEVVAEVVAPPVRPVTTSSGMAIAVSNKTK